MDHPIIIISIYFSMVFRPQILDPACRDQHSSHHAIAGLLSPVLNPWLMWLTEFGEPCEGLVFASNHECELHKH